MVFNHANGVSIDRSNFTSAQNAHIVQYTYNTHESAHPPDPLRTLLQHSAIEATHESADSSYAPTCHPGTREAIVKDIMDWAAGDAPSFPIIWFSGAAGGGKTCIQRKVAELCQAQGRLAASFFFSTRSANINNEKLFITTLAQQLSCSITGLQRYISDAIQKDPAIFDKSLEAQMKTLISQPMSELMARKDHGFKKMVKGCSRRKKRRSLIGNDWRDCDVILIDGLDECINTQEQAHILRIIHAAVIDRGFPFRFVISGRPEYEIRTAFGCEEFKKVTLRIRLDDYDGERDIRKYLCHAFAEIRRKHPSGPSIPTNWPSEDDVDTLVSKASSQFIYAATVVKFVSNRSQNPIQMLDLVMSLGSTADDNINPFSDLDALYATILHPRHADIPLLKRLVHAIMCSQSEWPTTLVLDQFLCLPPGTTDITLCDLHSILDIPPADNLLYVKTIRFHHRSLEDYLLSPERSLDLYQSLESTHRDLAERCIHHLECWASMGQTIVTNLIIHHSAFFWRRHVRAAFGRETPSFSEEFLNFDVTRTIKYAFLQPSSEMLKEVIGKLPVLQTEFHGHLCPEDGPCLLFCRRLRRIADNKYEIIALFRKAWAWGKEEEKLLEFEKLVAVDASTEV